LEGSFSDGVGNMEPQEYNQF